LRAATKPEIETPLSTIPQLSNQVDSHTVNDRAREVFNVCEAPGGIAMDPVQRTQPPTSVHVQLIENKGDHAEKEVQHASLQEKKDRRFMERERY